MKGLEGPHEDADGEGDQRHEDVRADQVALAPQHVQSGKLNRAERVH